MVLLVVLVTIVAFVIPLLARSIALLFRAVTLVALSAVVRGIGCFRDELSNQRDSAGLTAPKTNCWLYKCAIRNFARKTVLCQSPSAVNAP